MKIIIPGGSGQVGTMLARALHADGHEVVVLSRRKFAAPWRVVEWDGRSPAAWVVELDGANVLINLAGQSVNCRYHERNRRELLFSRLESTRAIGEALQTVDRPPRVWLQASTATIYAHRYDAPNDELTGILGGHEPDAPAAWNFSIDVATRWEQEALRYRTPRTRQVLMRSAMTMSPDCGGVFDYLLRLVRLGLGGSCGDGKQFMSWVHEYDFVRAIYWLIEHENLSGPVNIAAPGPLPNREFMQALRAAWGIGMGIPSPAWLLEIGTFVLRTESELMLKSRRVVPSRLLHSGFEFAYRTWPDAAQELCQRYRTRRNLAA